MKRVYLDYAAATPIELEVAKAMQESMANFANPASLYSSGRKAKEELEKYRKTLAMFLGANPDEVIFTSGATESNNLALLGAARSRGKGEIISTKSEHSSIRESLYQLEKEGFVIRWCPLERSGRINKLEFEKLLNKNTIMVSVSLANSEYGTVQDIAQLVGIVREHEMRIKNHILFHSDASAAALLHDCSVSRLGVDLLTLSGAKIYGPNGIGLLYVRRGSKIEPITWGGKQEFGLRAGSESIFLAAGFAKATEIVQTRRKQDEKHFQGLYTELVNYCKEKNVLVNGNSKKRLFSILSVSFDRLNGEDLVSYLDSLGFEVSTGAACEVSNELPSAALLAIGLSKEQAQGTLRVSFGRSTTLADVSAFTKALDTTLAILESHLP